MSNEQELPAETPLARKSIYFEGLNILRFFAAYGVILGHINCPLPDRKAFASLWHSLALGVDLFFIISGFLITYLLIEEKMATNTISFIKFYIRRSLRVFPIYYLLLLLSFLYFHFFTTGPYINYIPNLFFWGNFTVIAQGSWIQCWLTPIWSLCVEEHFYWVIPLLVYLTPAKYLKHLFGIVIGISICAKAYFAYSIAESWYYIYAHTLSKMDILAIGGLLACVHSETPIKFNISKGWMALGIITIILIMTAIDFSDYTTIFWATFRKYIINIPFLVLLCAVIFNEDPFIQKIRNNKYTDYLGKISYGLYMYHTMIIFFLCQYIPRETPLQAMFFIFIATIAIIAVSALSYEFFEKPILKLKSPFEVFNTKSQKP